MISPLVSMQSSDPQGQPKIGDLVTWVDYAGRELGGRLMRTHGRDVEIKVVGITVEWPYEIGQLIWRPADAIIDWSN